MLIESGTYDMERDVGPNGETGLHWAGGSGHLDVLLYLVKVGGVGGLTVRDKRSGRTVVHWVSRNGHLPLLLAMKERWPESLDFKLATYDGTTSLHLASYAGETATAEWLVLHGGCDPNFRNNYGCNSIFFACIGGRYQTAKFLYDECSVDAFAIQNQGHSALHKAAYAGSKDICDWLQDVVGLDVHCTLEDAKGHTAEDLARIKGYLELSVWLRRHRLLVVEDEVERI
jgi:ankyrin repeat protein